MRRPGARGLALASLAVLAALAVSTLAAHTALAAGVGNTSTTPIGSGPSVPALGPLYAHSDETKPIIGLFILVGIESAIVFVLVCAAPSSTSSGSARNLVTTRSRFRFTELAESRSCGPSFRL